MYCPAEPKVVAIGLKQEVPAPVRKLQPSKADANHSTGDFEAMCRVPAFEYQMCIAQKARHVSVVYMLQKQGTSGCASSPFISEQRPEHHMICLSALQQCKSIITYREPHGML